MSPLALLYWRPRLGALECAVLILAAGFWLLVLYRRFEARFNARRAWALILPKLLLLLCLWVAVLDPVSALQKKVTPRGKVLALLDRSSSMDVPDDYRAARRDRARQIIQAWRKALPQEVSLDELEFDTALAGSEPLAAGTTTRGTDLGSCLVALAERPDIASYQSVVVVTDGGDEPVDPAALPPLPVSTIAIGADPTTWNDLAVADIQAPPVAEKDVDFEVSADLQARAGHGGGFLQGLARVRVRLERQSSNTWTTVTEQSVDLASLRARVRFGVKSPTTGIERYRVMIDPLAGELSPLNNARTVNVEVRRKSLRVLYFTRELGQEFKVLRNELGRDPGLSFTALFRTAGERFTLQGDRVTGDAMLEKGLPSTSQGLAAYSVVILGSFSAAECSPAQLQALAGYADQGGTVAFLGGEESFGRGGYAASPLAPLFPWRLEAREAELAHGTFPILVAPAASGHPILATVEALLARGQATLDTVNQVGDLKPGALPLLEARVGQRSLAVAAFQRFGRGRVLGLASNTMWKWATEPEPLGAAYGLFWRQAVRYLTDDAQSGQFLAVKWDKELYRPGEQAVAEVRLLQSAKAGPPRFSGRVESNGQSTPVLLEPVAGQPDTYRLSLRFRRRGEFDFRLVVSQAERVVETYEKVFAVAPLASEGSRLEVDDQFLRRLAERGGGAFLRESEAGRFTEGLAQGTAQRVVVSEASLVEAGPLFFLLCLAAMLGEWTLRRRWNLI
jgi:uncharacterized membrane protein